MSESVTDVENKAERPVPREEPPEPSRRRRLFPVLLAGVILAAAVAVFFWLHYRNRVSTDDAQVDGHIAPISAKISGSVTQVLVDNNWHVKAGDVLVRIDPRDYQAKVDQARAALVLAQSQARAARVGVPLTRETTTSGTSGAEAQLANAQANYERVRIEAQQAGTSDIA